MKLLYFTSTGNCLQVAKAFDGELISIPQLIKDENFEVKAEKIGIIIPTHEFGVPHLIVDFLNKVKLEANYIFAIATYGAFSGAVTSHLNEVGAKNNIKFNYINSIKMVDNYLPFFKMEKQIASLETKEVEKNLEAIVEDVENATNFIASSNKAIKIIRPILTAKHHGDYDNNFTVTENCTLCKTCAKVCPVNNIHVDEEVLFGHDCEGCLACTHNCPQNAIRFKKERSQARFINENVTLAEIIAANK